MPLSAEEIQNLLNLPQKQRGKGKGGKEIDTSDRSVVVWFKLMHKMLDDDDPNEPAKCDNPNCQDTRPAHMVAEVGGKNMCRYCFLDGWLLKIEGQQSLGE